MKIPTTLAFFSLALCGAASAHADAFGSGANAFDIAFVDIVNPGNPADTTGNPNPAGSVDYGYRMGKFEISEHMIDKANALGALGITKDIEGPNQPASSITWFEAARFVNWLNTSTGAAPAYKFDSGGAFQLWAPGDAGYNPDNRYRNSLATYVLPNVDEWYKAAYYDPTVGVYYDYPTGSDATPTRITFNGGTAPGTAVYQQFALRHADVHRAGGLSPYGTMGQGGNVSEWEETDFDLLNDSTSLTELRGVKGGAYPSPALALRSTSRFSSSASSVRFDTGFRVASVLEAAPIFAADFDKDGDVDGDDLGQWAGDFGVNDMSDADDDGDSDGADFLAWQRQMGSATTMAAAVPEPATLLLLVSASLAMFLRRLVAVS